MTHFKSIFEILIRFLLEIPLELLSYLVVPIACLFIKDNKLPKVVNWFDDYDYGPNGDSGWQGPAHANGSQEKYLWRVRFLLRNRINTFSKVIQGFKSKDILSISYIGNVKVENRPQGVEGFLYVEATTTKRKYQEYYYIKRWGNSGRCLRIRIGWKLKDMLEEYLEDSILGNRDTREFAQFVFAINPLMSFVTSDS